ncbi:MAG: FAD-binding protein, partial [Planctomycetota bacterium]
YGNLVPRDIATREIFDICVNHGMGVGGGNMVYLDLTHKEPEYLTRKLGGIMEIYEKFVGDDPRELPMKIFPAVHYTMGGMWTTFTPGEYKPDEQWGMHNPGDTPPIGAEPGMGMKLGAPNNAMTNIKGLYAFGEVNFAYHGATRLGANALLSCIFDGLFCGLGVANYVRDHEPATEPAAGLDQAMFDNAKQAEENKVAKLLGTTGSDMTDDNNPYVIGKELGDEMTAACTVVKTGPRLEQCKGKLAELRERFSRVHLGDTATWTNQTLSYTRALGDMLVLAEVVALGSLERQESRGSHYRLDFPDRNDEQFLKATVVEYIAGNGWADAAGDGHKLTFRDVDTSLVKPRARTYGKVEATDDKKAESKSETAAPEKVAAS